MGHTLPLLVPIQAFEKTPCNNTEAGSPKNIEHHTEALENSTFDNYPGNHATSQSMASHSKYHCSNYFRSEVGKSNHSFHPQSKYQATTSRKYPKRAHMRCSPMWPPTQVPSRFQNFSHYLSPGNIDLQHPVEPLLKLLQFALYNGKDQPQDLICK